MATEFGLSAQMMLFAGADQRKLASQVLPIAEVLDRVKKLSLASELNDKKRLSASVMFTLGDLSAMNTIVKLVEVEANATAFAVLEVKTIEGYYSNAKDAEIKSAVLLMTKSDHESSVTGYEALNKTGRENKAYLVALGLGEIGTNTTMLHSTVDSQEVLTESGEYLAEIISLSKDTASFGKIKPIYGEVDKITQLKNDKKLLLESYATLDEMFEEFKGTEDLNLVEIVKDSEETKIESIAPVRIKKSTLVAATDLNISGNIKKWIPEMTTIEQLSFDYKKKTGAFEIIIKPGKDFPTNTKPSMFYLNRASLLLKRTITDD